jgi:type III secretion system YscI/HrpB-like protein
MAGEIISVVAQASTQSGWVDTPSLSSVSDMDAARLTDLLTPEDEPASTAAPVPEAADTSNNTLGDSILRNFDAVGRAYKEGSAEISKMLDGFDGAKLSTSDVLRMQFVLIDASLRVEMVSKATSKFTQHIDQLTKLQ